MKTNVLAVIVLALLFVFANCSDETSENGNDAGTDETKETVDPDDVEITVDSFDFSVSDSADFLAIVLDHKGMPRTWECSEDADQYLYFFFRANGSMAGGGDGGEETMWEANWEFVSGKLSVSLTMQPSDETQPLSGSYKVFYYPEDMTLNIGDTDYFIAEY